MKRIIVLLLAWSCLAAFGADKALFECAFGADSDIRDWVCYQKLKTVIETQPDGGKALRLQLDELGTAYLHRNFPAGAVTGRRIRLSAEFKGEKIVLPKGGWTGAKFMFAWTGADGKKNWPQSLIKDGSFDWEAKSFTVTLSDGVKDGRLYLGFDKSSGTLWVRNLRIEVLDSILDLAPVANMGLKDEVAGDGVGGWSDQGPENDAAKFPPKQRLFANVPFEPINLAKNNGKAVMVFKSGRFPQGLESASFDLATAGKTGRWLYLLHTVCYGQGNETVGFIDLEDADGGPRSLPVALGRDVADWWNPKPHSNAVVGATWEPAPGRRVGVYVSRFDLGEGKPAPKRIVFRSANGAAIWIVMGAIMSDTAYTFPGSAIFTIKADKVWKPVQRPEIPLLAPGSALDRSAFLPAGPAGSKGRVIVNAAGHLAFAGEPDRPVRFMSDCMNWGNLRRSSKMLDSREKIERYARELRANGYNMLRFHFLDVALSLGAPADGEFLPDVLERFEYLVYCLKQNGIYINLDAMTGGYRTLDPWHPNTPNRYFAFKLHFDDDTRTNWLCVEKILTKINPHTGTRLAEDPVLAMVNGKNEQEFGFSHFIPADPGPVALARWHGFLRKRYSDIAALKKAWGIDAPAVNDFTEILFFTVADNDRRTGKGGDAWRFRREVERDTQTWYRTELRRMGYNGLFANYDMAKNWHYAGLRNHLEAVNMHYYHAHPSKGVRAGSSITQASSIAGLATLVRGGMSGRVAGKPFMVTEYANVFWNRYRYEQAFVNAAYGAFQGFDALTAFASSVQLTQPFHIRPFNNAHDPIQRASEFLSFFLFERGDVRPADTSIRIVDDLDKLYETNDIALSYGLSALQSKLFLVTGLSISAIEKDAPLYPARKHEVLVPRQGGGASVIKALGTAGFAEVADGADSGAFDPDGLLNELKKRGFLAKDNRSVLSKDIFESSTGELFLDAKKNFMSVKTPRLQGVCGEAGTKADFGALRIDEMTVKGNLALVSVDGEKPLAQSERMVLVFATDALNEGMVFEEKERLTLNKVINGADNMATLIETGKFRVTIRHSRAAELKLWALDLAGNRKSEVARIGGGTNEAAFAVDTAALPNGPSLYFELAVK